MTDQPPPPTDGDAPPEAMDQVGGAQGASRVPDVVRAKRAEMRAADARKAERAKVLPGMGHLTIARDVIAQVVEATETEPGHTEGDFWRYVPETGTWGRWTEGEVGRTIHTYQGRAYQAKDEKKHIAVSDAWARGVWGRLRAATLQDDFFDNAPAAMAFPNTVLVVKGSEIVEVDKCHTRRLRHAFADPYLPSDAACPRWRKFLAETFPEDAHSERAEFLQEYVGACLFGLGTRLQRALLLIGKGSDGKSTFLEIVSALFPDDAICSVTPLEMDKNRFTKALFVGKLINVVHEVSQTEMVETGGFKTMITGDTVTFENKFQRGFRGRSRAGNIISANAWPNTRDHSRGYWRRWIPVPFLHQVSPGRENRYLAREIVQGELPGIVAWGVRGARRIVARGLRLEPPGICVEHQGRWREDADTVAQWLEEQTRISDNARRRDWTPCKSLHADFQIWAGGEGVRGMSARKFRHRLEALEVETHNGRRGWIAQIRLGRTDSDSEPDTRELQQGGLSWGH